jgi:hypothetical protein
MIKKVLYQEAKTVRNWALSHENAYRSLQGWCVKCSYKLFKKLRQKKLNPTFCASKYHCFVLCDDFLIDVTATQFGEKPIIVEKFSKEHEERFWDIKNSDKFKSIKLLNSFLINHWYQPEWPQELANN